MSSPLNTELLEDEIQKRMTLNWLIQGAAQHAGMTFHHLVREELNALDPRLLRAYDQFALINLLQYWEPSAALILGWPSRFWNQAASSPDHPFYGHPVLSRYGGMLAEESRERARQRSREKGLTRLPVAMAFQADFIIKRLRRLESPHRARLAQLALDTASMVWGIPRERLDGELTGRIVPWTALPARSIRGQAMRGCIAGLGGVVVRGNKLIVMARGTNWQLLAKELVKGTAELICLHGLNRLCDVTYRRVIEATDWLELEPAMLQSGGELWRRLLLCLPADRAIAKVLMNLARLPASSLHSVITAVIENPQRGRELL